MDDPRNEIKRDALLKLGGAGALAAIAAVLADGGAVEAYDDKKKKPPGRRVTNPIGLDFTATAKVKPQTGPPPIHRVLITATEADLHKPTTADERYTLILPKLRGKGPHGNNEDDDIDVNVYVGIWLKG